MHSVSIVERVLANLKLQHAYRGSVKRPYGIERVLKRGASSSTLDVTFRFPDERYGIVRYARENCANCTRSLPEWELL